MKVYIDADASPVKDIVIEETTKSSVPVILVASYAHFSEKEYPDHVSIVWVDSGSDQADFKIMQLVKAGDIVITQDYGLASMLLSKKCIVLHHSGYEFTSENIDSLITSRHLAAVQRKQTGRVTGVKSLSPFSEEEQQDFRELLKEKLAK
jgi:hypothetical protein